MLDDHNKTICATQHSTKCSWVQVDGVLNKVTSKDRQDRLIDIIRNGNADALGSLQIQYTYYNCSLLRGSLQACIWLDVEFHPYLLACCNDPIT